MMRSVDIWFFLKSFFVVLLFFYATAHLLVFFKLGHFILLSPIGAQSVLRDPLFRGEFFVALAFLFLMTSALFFIHNEYHRFKEENERAIYKISLAELSQLWSPEERHSATESKKQEDFNIPDNTVFLDRSKFFFEKWIKPSISFFPKEKLSIIIELFKILEADGVKAPSVAKYFDKDPERTGSYKSPVTASGLSSYDVFYQINLYEHTMNVLDESIKYIIKKDAITYETVICDAVIVALAHDIGKLGVVSLYGTEYPSEILKNNPHPHISKLFFSESWPGYELIEEAIFSHHSAPKSNALLTRMIIEADKEARKKELSAYLQKTRIIKNLIKQLARSCPIPTRNPLLMQRRAQQQLNRVVTRRASRQLIYQMKLIAIWQKKVERSKQKIIALLKISPPCLSKLLHLLPRQVEKDEGEKSP